MHLPHRFGHRLTPLLCLISLATAAAQACHLDASQAPEGAAQTILGAGQESVEDLTIVVEADKSRILQEEAAVKAGKEEVEAQRQRLQKERTEVAERISTLTARPGAESCTQ